MAKNRNEIVLPAAELGTDPLSQVLQQLPAHKSETSIGTAALSQATPFRETSSTDISELSSKQVNRFYLSPDASNDSRLMNEIQANDQAIWESAGKGLTKFAFKTGTSVLGGTIGTVYGGLSAIANGEFSKLYDNDVNKWLDKKNEWIDTQLPIYESQEAQKNEWYNKILPFTDGSAKFWFDDVAGGLSFTAGAVITEMLTAGAATSSLAVKAGSMINKAVNLDKALSVTTKATNILKRINTLENIKDGATFTRQLITGAGYEAGVEARHTKDEILSDLKKKYQEQNGVAINEESPEYAVMVSDANKAANTVFAANMAILNLGNAVALPKTFGKLSSTFDKTLGKLTSPVKAVSSLSDDVLERTAVNLGKTVDEVKGLDFVSKWDTYNKLTKGALNTASALKSPLAEGLWEEGMQGTVGEAAKKYVAKKYDGSNQGAVMDLVNSFGEAFTKTYGTSEGFKEIAIGMIIGAMGLPHIGKNEDGSAKIGWEGGIYGGITGNSVEKQQVQQVVDLMNNNKALNSTKAMWQAANRNASESKPPENFFEAKNQENEDFFNYAYSRYKGGYLSNITDELSKQIKSMTTQAFAETFGYTNMTDAELESRKKEVITKTQQKANNIKEAIELAEKINKTGDEDVTEGLAYTIANLKDVDTREEQIANDFSNALGFVDTRGLREIMYENNRIMFTENWLNKYDSEVKKLKEYKKTLDGRKKETREEFKATKEEIESLENKIKKSSDKVKTLKEEELLKRESNKRKIEKYDNDFEKFEEDVSKFVDLKNRIAKLKREKPEVAEDLQEKFDDLSKLAFKRQDFINTYNNLYSKENQEKFKQDIDGFKNFTLSELPEDITKHSATLSYYKALGQKNRALLEKQNNISTTNTPSEAQASKVNQVNKTQAVQAAQEVLNTPSQTSQNPVLATSGETSQAGNVNTPVEENITPQVDVEVFNFEDDSDRANEAVLDAISSEDSQNLFALMQRFTAGDKSIAAGFDDTFEKNIEFQKQAAPILKNMIQQIEDKSPNITRKNVSIKVLNFMHDKMGIGEEQYNLLKAALNSIVGRNKDEDSVNLSYSEFSNLKSDVKVIQTYDLADQDNAIKDLSKNKDSIVKSVNDSIAYNHTKNVIPHLSLAYLSHNYEEGAGQIVTQEVNEAGKPLLSLKNFTNPANIIGTMNVDSTNAYQGSDDLLDHPIKIELVDKVTNAKVTTFLHVPKWIIDVKDYTGNSIISNDKLTLLVGLALENNIEQLTKELSDLVSYDRERFRNVGLGENGTIQDVATMFTSLVNFRESYRYNNTPDLNIDISDISNGKISFMNSFENASEFLPSETLQFAVVDQNKQLKTNKNTIVNTSYANNGLKSGEVVVILPLKNEKTIPVSVRLKNTNKEQQDIFVAGVKEFLSDKPQTIKIKSNTLNLGIVNNLKKFLSVYVSYIPNMSSYNFVDLENNRTNYSLVGKVLIDFSDATDSKSKAVQIVMLDRIKDKNGNVATLFVRKLEDLNKTVSELIKEQDLVYTASVNDASKTFGSTTVEQLLKDSIKNKLSTIETDVAGEQLIESPTNKTKIPIVSVTDGKLDISKETISYTEHIKSRVLTNVNGRVNVGTNENPDYTYIEQPVFVMNGFPKLNKGELVEAKFTPVMENVFDIQNEQEEEETNIAIEQAEQDMINNPDDFDFLFEDKLIISERTKQELNDKTDECQ